MATNHDIRVRVLTMRELEELRHDMLDASAWMREELRYRRMRKEPTGFDLFEAGHPKTPLPKMRPTEPVVPLTLDVLVRTDTRQNVAPQESNTDCVTPLVVPPMPELARSDDARP